LGFALTWNYWFNDAVSTAADLTALQLVFAYWDTSMPGYALSLIFWVFLIFANIVTVRAYGELEYWLSLLKVVTITTVGQNPLPSLPARPRTPQRTYPAS